MTICYLVTENKETWETRCLISHVIFVTSPEKLLESYVVLRGVMTYSWRSREPKVPPP